MSLLDKLRCNRDISKLLESRLFGLEKNEVKFLDVEEVLPVVDTKVV